MTEEIAVSGNLLYGISKLPPPLSSPLACPPSL